MKKNVLKCIAFAAFALVSQTVFAQRPESMYARRAFLGMPVQEFQPTSTKSAQAIAPIRTVDCPACDLVSFTSFTPDNVFVPMYGTVSIWTHTYDGTTPDPVYSGSYLNFKKGCLNFMHYADNTYAPMSYWDGFTVSKTKTFPCPLVCTNTCNGLEDQFSSITGGGQLGVNDPYSVAYYGYNASYFPANHCIMNLDAANTVCGMYITNNAYAYKSMKCGDSFARKFAAGDSLVLYVDGYLGATYKGKVKYYLADFRGTSTVIVNTWKWVNLTSLGSVDRLEFSMATSDVGPYGPNTPMYFCVDEIKLGVGGTCGSCTATGTTTPPIFSASKSDVISASAITVTPNPATTEIQISAEAGSAIQITDWQGENYYTHVTKEINETVVIAAYPKGAYIVTVTKDSVSQTVRFIKE